MENKLIKGKDLIKGKNYADEDGDIIGKFMGYHKTGYCKFITNNPMWATQYDSESECLIAPFYSDQSFIEL